MKSQCERSRRRQGGIEGTEVGGECDVEVACEVGVGDPGDSGKVDNKIGRRSMSQRQDAIEVWENERRGFGTKNGRSNGEQSLAFGLDVEGRGRMRIVRSS